MKNYILIPLLALLLLACKPEANLEATENNKSDVLPQELPTMPKQKLTAEVHLSVPDTRWSIKIVNVVQTNSEIAVLCQLSQSDMMGMMVISEVVDAVEFTAQNLPIKYYILGKTWNWENHEGYSFMDIANEERLLNGESIPFEHVKPTQANGPKKQPIESLL